jgi:hypothetical protein
LLIVFKSDNGAVQNYPAMKKRTDLTDINLKARLEVIILELKE